MGDEAIEAAAAPQITEALAAQRDVTAAEGWRIAAVSRREDAVLHLLELGMRPRRIAEILKVPRMAIWRIIRRAEARAAS